MPFPPRVSSWCPTCPSVLVSSAVVFTGSPDPRQHPFGSGHGPLSGQLYGGPRRSCRRYGIRFPVSFRPPALACWILLRPLRMGTFLTVGLPSKYRLDLIGVVAFRLSEIRPGWVSSEPRGRWCAPDRQALSGRHPPLSNGQPYHPLVLPIYGSLLDEASSRIHSHSPFRSSPTCDSRMERESLGLDLRLRTPQLPATHAEAGTGRAHWPGSYTFDISRTSLVMSTQLKRPRVASARSNTERPIGAAPTARLIHDLNRIKEQRRQRTAKPIFSPERASRQGCRRLIRLDAYWNGHALDRTKTSHLARLDLALAA